VSPCLRGRRVPAIRIPCHRCRYLIPRHTPPPAPSISRTPLPGSCHGTFTSTRCLFCTTRVSHHRRSSACLHSPRFGLRFTIRCRCADRHGTSLPGDVHGASTRLDDWQSRRPMNWTVSTVQQLTRTALTRALGFRICLPSPRCTRLSPLFTTALRLPTCRCFSTRCTPHAACAAACTHPALAPSGGRAEFPRTTVAQRQHAALPLPSSALPYGNVLLNVYRHCLLPYVLRVRGRFGYAAVILFFIFGLPLRWFTSFGRTTWSRPGTMTAMLVFLAPSVRHAILHRRR